MTDNEMSEAETESFLENLLYDQNSDIAERIGYVAEFYEHYSKKLIKLLNSNNEDERPILLSSEVAFYIEPHRVGKRDYSGMDVYLAVSKEVEKELQEWCNKKLNK